MHLTTIARRYPEKNAIAMTGSGMTVTYRELDERSRAIADSWAANGLRAGDHIAILMGNRPEFLETCWAAQRSGLYYTPVNWHLTKEEASYVTDDCGARVLVAGDEIGDLAAQVLADCPRVETAMMAGSPRTGFLDHSSIAARNEPDSVHEEREGYYFFYSSGTTGRPKGIEPTHSFPPFGKGLRLDHMLPSAYGVGADSVYLCPAPLYHAAPLGWSLGFQRHGGTVVVMESFDPVECLRAIERYGVTHAQFVPTMFVRMLKLPARQRDGFDLSSLKVIVHAGAPCPTSVKREMIDWLGPKLIEYYAGSEGGGMTMITAKEWLAKPGSVGKATYGTIHVLDDDGVELPAGEVGTVYFSGAEGFSYHNDAAKTAASRNSAGWHTIGDLGHLDADGYLYLSDRRNDLIISGGVNIYPQEVEGAIIMHPAVADVAVVGIDDPEMGQSVHAVVEPAPGVVTDSALVEELTDFCRGRLARFKTPRSMTFVDALPRTPAGKLLRRRVREDLAQDGTRT
ncbi:acyl-CoA synthetase [Nocardia arizonensis]|uniref:acyl-CoA synthetase n=1 Tax=Nocardia arizonensis TaxID=1141647 RepID=UPI0006D0AFEC|nr:acyl-CoA synthetase [Nocardia arizonensis]